jgi:DNA polymerase-3 subunit alpha
MDGFEKDGYWWFNCGCRFEIIGPKWGSSKTPKLRSILDKHNVNHTINFDCPATWELLSKGFTKGVFQLESPLGRQWCKNLKPENLENMAALGALLRPGCLRAKDYTLVCKDCHNKSPIKESHDEEGEKDYCPECGGPNVRRVGVSMTEHYCKRKNQEELVERYHESIDPILSTTYNVLTYQEQSMQIAAAVANFNLQEADVLRKAIGKKLPEEMAKVKKLFIEKSKEAMVVSEDQAEEIFGWIEKSQRYSFNKSHSASYGETGYICAFAKTHFPLGFYRKWLEFAQAKPDSKEESKDLVNEARITSDIRIRPPDIRFMKTNVHSDGSNIFFGLQDVKDVGPAQIKKLQEVLDKYNIKKEEIADIGWRIFMMYIGEKVTSSAINALIRVGALSCFKVDRSVMEYEYDIWHKLTDKEQAFAKSYYARTNSAPEDIQEIISIILKHHGYHDDRRGGVLVSILDSIVNSPYIIQDTIDYLVHCEEELLGVSLTCHITDSLLTAQETHSCKDIVKGYKGYAVLKVSLEDVRPWKIKNGQSAGKYMAFIKASDSSCQLDNIVAFPEVYNQYSYLLSPGTIVYITGKVSEKGSFTIERIYEHTQ